MEDQLLQFIEQNHLLARDQSAILAVSGGIDSVVMAHLFHKLGRHFEIAHCNFSLRGDASNQDEAMVKGLAEKLGVPLQVKSFDTKIYAANNNLSIQMAARELRYNWFNELVDTNKNKKIATAHHQGDVVETMLFNLTKGTGISGLHGILVKRDYLIRPMLFATRADIENYAKEQAIFWREDESNDSTKYARNLIRHKVVPVLRKINPSLAKGFSKTAKRIQQSEEFLTHAVQQLVPTLVSVKNEDVFIARTTLIALPGAEFVLFEMIKEYGFNYDQAQAIITLDNSSCGALFYSSANVLNVDREFFVISPRDHQLVDIKIQEEDQQIKFENTCLTLERIPIDNLSLDPSSKVAFIDQGKLDFPLVLRTWQQGDYFYPLGLGGKKKLSDFMIDSKIALNLKRSVLVLVSGDDIIWVVGHRLDDRYKVENKTKQVLKVVIREN